MMNKMNIALDYDNTYTLDSDLWDVFIKLLAMRGHTVYIVTMRYVTQPIEPILDLVPGNVHYTSGKAKRKFMTEHNIRIDVWVDDIPDFILYDAEDI